MQPASRPQLEIDADGGAEWSLQDRDASARVILSHRVLIYLPWFCTLFTISWSVQMTLRLGNVAMSSNNEASFLFLEHYEDSDPWSSSSLSSNHESLETTLLDIDCTDEVLPIPENSFLHDRQNYAFILKTALWHLVPSFIPSQRCSSHALPLKHHWSYLDGLRGVAATFVFGNHYHYAILHIHAEWIPTLLLTILTSSNSPSFESSTSAGLCEHLLRSIWLCPVHTATPTYTLRQLLRSAHQSFLIPLPPSYPPLPAYCS